MKLLFDENLSPKLPRILAARFPGSLHLRDCGLKGATDESIWDYARANGFTIVSKDADFYQRSLFTAVRRNSFGYESAIARETIWSHF